MKLEKEQIEKAIENIIFDGIVNGEEIDITTKKIMDAIWPIIQYLAIPPAIDADRKGRWISVKDELPEAEKRVLLWQRVSDIRRVPIIGFYAPKHTIDCDGSDDLLDLDTDYCVEKDMFYLPEGFYELVENWGDFSFLSIPNGEITHWQPLP